VHAGLSAAIRSQAFNFSPTQQADLNLPVLSLSSRIECDGIFYSPLSADARKTSPYCVLYSDGDVEWRSASEARSEHRAAQQLALLLSISPYDSLVGMLGLRPACGYQEVAIEYNKSVKLIHPDQCFLDGAAEAFMKLQPAYTEWNAARACQGWSHPAAPSSAPVSSDSRHPNKRPSSHSEDRGGLGARPPLASQSRRPGVPQQRTGAESATSGSNSANVPQNAGINSAPAHDSIFRHFISSLNPDDPSVTWMNAGALDFLSRLERDGRLFELRAFTSPPATDLNDIQRSLFKDCVKKTLTMAGPSKHEKRACAALRQLARTLPLLLLTHSKMEIRAVCNKFLKGEWESLWNKCVAKGHASQDKLAANSLSAS